MRHIEVTDEPDFYDGWPANHGHWQWGNELLFGFLRGKRGHGSFHGIVPPYQKLLARSTDAGESWKIEVPNVDFEACCRPTPAPEFSLETTIIRACGVYDTGGDDCYPEGGFYTSDNRGKTWSGPYAFTGWKPEPAHICTARTDVVAGLNLVMVSQRNADRWGTDNVVCLHHNGMCFEPRATAFPGKGRIVMPSTVVCGDKLLTAVRRLGDRRGGWVDLFSSDDQGHSWAHRSEVGSTGGSNGNPPALLSLGQEKIICAYANRSHGEIRLRQSLDAGQTWLDEIVACTGVSDIGYPRLFSRPNGGCVCVYYFSDKPRRQHIRATLISPSDLS